jgi:hypothetical protein
MSEATMVELAQAALQARGIDDRIEVAGQFSPRGHSGGMFAGGLVGGELGEGLGGVGEAIGVGVGSLGGMDAADAASGLPAKMLVAVSPTTVYGFAAATRHSEPTAVVFQVERDGLEAKVHRRANVRVLELIHGESGSAIELEGNRLPMTHSEDVIAALRS